MDDDRKYFPILDIMKFCATIIILLHHYYLNTNLPELKLFAHGGIFVELFFMISGFIGGVLIDRIEAFSFKGYILRIGRRFIPMAALSVIIYAIFGIYYYISFGTWYRSVAIDLWSISTSISLTFAGGAVGNVSLGVNNPIWYLCVLLICHSILYFIKKFSGYVKISVAYGFILMIFAGVSANTYDIRFPFLNSMVARGYYTFFAGCIIAMILNHVKRYMTIWLMSAVVIIIYLLPNFMGWSFLYENWKLSMPMVLFPAIVVIGSIPGKKNHIARFLAAWSFEIYIWQGMVLLLQGIMFEYGLISVCL